MIAKERASVVPGEMAPFTPVNQTELAVLGLGPAQQVRD